MLVFIQSSLTPVYDTISAKSGLPGIFLDSGGRIFRVRRSSVRDRLNREQSIVGPALSTLFRRARKDSLTLTVPPVCNTPKETHDINASGNVEPPYRA